MKVEVIKIGKIKHPGIKDLGEKYLKRIKPFLSVETSLWKDTSPEDRLLKLTASGHWIVALDERGKQFSSLDLSKQLVRWQNQSQIKHLVFVIGGPYGLSSDFKSSVNFLWSLSSCTLPSDLSWVLVCEQLYRAVTIAKGMRYHHE